MENFGQLYDEVIKMLKKFSWEHKTDVSIITLSDMYSLECYAESVEWKDGKTMPTKEELYYLAELCWNLSCDFQCDVSSDTVARVVIEAYERSEYTSVNEFIKNADLDELEDDLSYSL